MAVLGTVVYPPVPHGRNPPGAVLYYGLPYLFTFNGDAIDATHFVGDVNISVDNYGTRSRYPAVAFEPPEFPSSLFVQDVKESVPATMVYPPFMNERYAGIPVIPGWEPPYLLSRFRVNRIKEVVHPAKIKNAVMYPERTAAHYFLTRAEPPHFLPFEREAIYVPVKASYVNLPVMGCRGAGYLAACFESPDFVAVQVNRIDIRIL